MMTLRAYERKTVLVKKINALRSQLCVLWVDDPTLYRQPTSELKREYRILLRKCKGKYVKERI